MLIGFTGALGGALALCAATSAAFAHAQLQGASPPAGGEVAAPSEIRLTFSEAVEPKFCAVTLTDASGAAQPASRPGLAPNNGRTLVVKLGKPLSPGAYWVKWRAVSTDTHHTQGEFRFTVK